MTKLNKDNFRKAFFYLKKNGVKNTVLATMERLTKGLYDDYTYTAPFGQNIPPAMWQVGIYIII